VKTVEMAEATGALSEYAKQVRRDPVVVMRRYKAQGGIPLEEIEREFGLKRAASSKRRRGLRKA
jgi:methylphosphotriester-DNA--protein-cysteine methyltransferase